MEKLWDFSSKDIASLLQCPKCNAEELIPVIVCESTLSARNNKVVFWVNCQNCNRVSLVTYFNPSTNPRIKIELLSFDIQEFIKDVNDNLPQELKDKGAKYDIKDYLKK